MKITGHYGDILRNWKWIGERIGIFEETSPFGCIPCTPERGKSGDCVTKTK